MRRCNGGFQEDRRRFERNHLCIGRSIAVFRKESGSCAESIYGKGMENSAESAGVLKNEVIHVTIVS